MPYVNIRLIEGITKEQKADLIEGVTNLLYEKLNKKPESTYVVIDEVSADNWGVGGQSLAVIRAGGPK